MSPEALRQAAITLFGERGWMSRLAESLRVDRSSVSRWFAGLPVPGPVAAAVEAWLMLYKLTGLRPDELGRLDQIRTSGEEDEPPLHRFRK
jgi:hypothetical protein